MAAAKEKDPAGGLATLYVGDLHTDVTESVLHERFQAFGPIAMIHVCRDSVTRRSLGYAYVNYYSHAHAQEALEKLNYTEIKGRCCRIMWNKKERQVLANQDANIFIKNLDPHVDSRALYDTFAAFGTVLSCKVACDVDGHSRGYGFVQYETEEMAKQAIEKGNGMDLVGRRIFVGPFIKRDRNELHQGGDGSLYVKNIPGDWDDTKVSELFAPFGEVASSLVLNDARSGKRYAFVNFKDPDAAKSALQVLHGKDLRTDEERAAMSEKESQKKEATPKEGEGGEEGQEEEKAAEAEASPDDKAADDRDDDKDDGADKKDKLPSWRLIVSHSKSKTQRDMEAKGRKDVRPEQRFEGIKLHVRNLPTRTSDDSLKELFKEFGTVTDVKSVTDRETGQCKGYGFVRFSTLEEATGAMTALNGKELVPGQPPLQVGLSAGKGGDRMKGSGKGFDDGGGKGFFGGKGKFSKGKGKGFPMKGGCFPQSVPGGMFAPPPPMMYGMPGMPMQGMPARPMFAGMPGMASMGMFGAPMAMMRPGFMPPFAQRPGMPPAGGAMPPAMAQMPGQAAAPAPAMPLNAAALANAPPHVRKQMLGEKLYPMIGRYEPQLAGKITGMLLEMDDTELLILLESEPTLREKVSEAVAVLHRNAAKAAVPS